MSEYRNESEGLCVEEGMYGGVLTNMPCVPRSKESSLMGRPAASPSPVSGPIWNGLEEHLGVHDLVSTRRGSTISSNVTRCRRVHVRPDQGSACVVMIFPPHSVVKHPS